MAEFEKLIDLKKKELLKKQNEVHAFVDVKHAVKATRKYQKEVRILAKNINEFAILLIETKETAGEHKGWAEKLCAESLVLNGLVKDMGQILANDLGERQREEAFDVVKLAGVVASLAAGTVTISKGTFDPHSSHVAAEASVGASIGLCAACWRPIYKSFVWAAKQVCVLSRKIEGRGNIALASLRRAGKEICAFPEAVKQGFMLYYAKQTAKELGQSILKLFKGRESPAVPVANDDKPNDKTDRGSKAGSRSDSPSP